MKRSLAILVLFFSYEAFSQSDIENLLNEADSAINSKNQPPVIKKSPQRRKNKPLNKPGPSQSKSEREKDIRFSEDPELARLLTLNAENVNDLQGASEKDRIIWSVGYIYKQTPAYSLEKDDDFFHVAKGNDLHGIQIGYFPITFHRSGSFLSYSSFALTVLNTSLDVERTGLIEEAGEYTHRMINVDMGIGLQHNWPDKLTASVAVMGSMISVMQDGDQDSDTIFDARPGLALQVGLHRQIYSHWGLSFLSTFRDQSLGGEVGALHGISYGLALSYAGTGS